MWRLLGNDQPDQVDVQPDVHEPSDDSTDERGGDSLGIERSVVASTELEMVRRANEGAAHQRRYPCRSASYGCGPEKPAAPTARQVSHRGIGRDSEIGRRRLGS